MRSPDIPPNESARLTALCALDVLDTPPEKRFDCITHITQRHFEVPIALVSLVDAGRQWFKSRQGLDATETPRDISFCGHAILSDDILHIPNALDDPRFSGNPLVTGAPHIRFYAGAPLHAAGGERIGTLCIIDNRPRVLSADDLAMLRELADCVEGELEHVELRASRIQNHSMGSRLSAVINTVVDGIITIDAHGIVETMNPAAERIFGYSATEVIGRNVKILMPEPYHSAHDGYLNNYLDTGKHKIIGSGREVIGRRKDGSTFPMELAVSEMPVRAEVKFTGIVRDISARKAIEAERLAAITEADRANRAKSEFLSSMSHELRTPLNSILGFAQVLENSRKYPLVDKQKEYVRQILKSGQHLLDLINDVLDLSRVEAGKLSLSIEPITLPHLVEECLTIVRGQADQQGITLVVPVAAMSFTVRADRMRLKQVLLNLLSNAIKYNRPRGKVTLTATRTDSDHVRIVVEDTGPGIPEAQWGNLFKPFNRLGAETSEIEGTGIGLTISQRLINAMDGTIGFSSVAGQGSSFWIEIPATAPVAYNAATKAGAREFSNSLNYAGSRRRRMLYIEDNPSNVRLLEGIVDETTDLEVASLPSAEPGLEAAARDQPDLILLDINLPGMNGIEALHRFKSNPRTRNIPILALSADAMPGTIRKAMEAGCLDYVTKPIDVARLLAAIRSALEEPRTP